MILAVISLRSVSAFVPSLLKGTEPLVLYDENTSPNWGQRPYQWQHRDSQVLHESWTNIWDGYMRDNTAWNSLYTIVFSIMYSLSVWNALSALYTSSAMHDFKGENECYPEIQLCIPLLLQIVGSFSSLAVFVLFSRVISNIPFSSRNLGTKC